MSWFVFNLLKKRLQTVESEAQCFEPTEPTVEGTEYEYLLVNQRNILKIRMTEM